MTGYGNYTIVNSKLSGRVKNPHHFSTNEKKNQNQLYLVHAIFPRFEQVTGNCYEF